ncbi:MAG: beta-ketoacyl synthase chain length factor [Bacteroidota bacterium]
MTAPETFEKDYLTCIEPDYKEIINPNLIRRMGRVIKMGVAASMKCLKDMGLENPDAIITGTSLGCIEDTEKFLNQIVINKEQFLAPTSFIQSTHNTIAGQIALLLKCNAYNYAYVHRNFSFENALLDALMMLDEQPDHKILLGGVDEITKVSYDIMQRLGIYKSAMGLTPAVYHHPTEGSIAGEGSAFFVVSNQSENAFASVNGVKIFSKPADASETQKQIHDFITTQGLTLAEIDAVIMGYSGDQQSDGVYNEVSASLFEHNNILYYKHLCGEYYTSSSFAMWAAANILKHQSVPEAMKYRFIADRPLKNVLIYNQYKNSEHSIIHLSA